MARNVGYVTVRITNASAIEAFADACERVASAARDMPWRDDLREAEAKLREAAEGFEVSGEKR